MPAEDLKSIRRREDLPPDLRALSDVLDEYLARMHGITSGWVSPVEFREFLAEAGLVVVSREDLDAVRRELSPEGRIGRTLLHGSHPTAANIARNECLDRLRAALTESPTHDRS